jgi:hypothetical protein
LLLGAGYGIYLWLTPAGKQEAVCALVIDRTSSSSQPKTVERYKALATKTIEGCKEKKAAMSVYYFDQHGPKLLLLNDQPYLLWGKGRKSSARQASVDAEMKRAQSDLNTVFTASDSSARGSDIATALHSVAENVDHDAAKAGVTPKYIVLLTDGVQMSDDLTLSGLTSGDSDVSPLVDRVKQLALSPQLDGARVSFIGVRAGVKAASGQQLPQLFEAKVQDFWTAVVQAGQGHLCTYVPDANTVPVSC